MGLRQGREKPPERKIKRVENLKNELEDAAVIGIIDLHKMPAAQLQEMRLALGDKARILMDKKTVMRRAIDAADKESIEGIEEYIERDHVQPALLFTDMNPFSLFKFLDENKSDAPANAGDIAPRDITIKEGDTGIPPGPAIGTLSAIGLQPQVQDGTIHVARDKVVAKEDEAISHEVANVLKMLDIQPMEIGLNMIAAYEDGVVYDKRTLRIDEEEFAGRLHASITSGINLSLNTGYITPQTAPLAIIKAFKAARAVALDSGAYEKGVISELLAKAVKEAKALEGSLPEEEAGSSADEAEAPGTEDAETPEGDEPEDGHESRDADESQSTETEESEDLESNDSKPENGGSQDE